MTTAVVASARQRAYHAVAGGVLVAAAGIPVSLQRAVAVVLGSVLLLCALAPRRREVSDSGS